MKEGKWIRWLGAASALFVVAIFVGGGGGVPNTEGHKLFYVTLMLLPAFFAVFLSIFARFWWAFSIGLWLFLFSMYGYISSFSEETPLISLLMVLASATICLTPFLHRAYRPKSPDTKKDIVP